MLQLDLTWSRRPAAEGADGGERGGAFIPVVHSAGEVLVEAGGAAVVVEEGVALGATGPEVVSGRLLGAGAVVVVEAVSAATRRLSDRNWPRRFARRRAWVISRSASGGIFPTARSVVGQYSMGSSGRLWRAQKRLRPRQMPGRERSVKAA